MKTTIPFIHVLPANTKRTVISDRLPRMCRITNLSVNFPVGCEYNVWARFYVTTQREVPDDEWPEGQEVNEILRKGTRIRGDGEVFTMPCDINVSGGNNYLAVTMYNSDTNTHMVASSVTVETLLVR